jgi:hypothetical protein
MPDLRTAQSWQSAASSMPGSYSPQRTSAPNPSSGVGYNHMIPTATATDAATTRKPVASASPPSNTLFDSFNKSFPPLSEEDAKGNSASSSGLLARPPILAQQLNASMEAAGKELERNLQDMIKRLDYLTSGSKERLGELTGAIQHGLGKGLGTKPEEKPKSNGVKEAKEYTKRFCDFMTANPTVWHAVDAFARRLEGEGFKRVCFPSPTINSATLIYGDSSPSDPSGPRPSSAGENTTSNATAAAWLHSSSGTIMSLATE